jgi:hypothetical protein
MPPFFLFKPKEPPMEPKDPMDWKLTDNSKEWDYETYCPQCKCPTEHMELMTDICGSCGYFGWLLNKKRVFRQIWDGTKWVWQYKYGNGPKDYEIVEKKYEKA